MTQRHPWRHTLTLFSVRLYTTRPARNANIPPDPQDTLPRTYPGLIPHQHWHQALALLPSPSPHGELRSHCVTSLGHQDQLGDAALAMVSIDLIVLAPGNMVSVSKDARGSEGTRIMYRVVMRSRRGRTLDARISRPSWGEGTCVASTCTTGTPDAHADDDAQVWTGCPTRTCSLAPGGHWQCDVGNIEDTRAVTRT